MSGFETLDGAVDPGKVQAIITAEEAAFSSEDLDDATALGLVLSDTQSAISFLQSKNLMPTGIDKADDLVRGFVRPRVWPDGKPKANMPMHTVLEAIEKILPTVYMALFGTGKRRPFDIEPIGKTTPEAARAKASVLSWAIKQSDLKEEMRLTLKNILTYGFGVGWWGWKPHTIRKKVYAKTTDNRIEGKWKEIDCSIPTYQSLSLKNVLVDPRCDRQDVQNGAEFIIKQMMLNANVLDDLRTDKDYKNIPSNEELRTILSAKDEPTEDTLTDNKRAVWRDFQAQLESESSSKDPLMQPLEYLEYWTKDRVIGVLQRKIVIRNQPNEFAEIPAVSCAFIDILGSAWGFGIARLLSGEQNLQTGVINNWIDSLALVLNPTYQLTKGIGPGTQNINISPGKVVTESGELKPLVTPDVTGPAMTAVATSEERGSKRVGSNGGTNLPDQALRTGTGVNALQGDVIQRLHYFLEIFISRVYAPVLEKFLMLCYDKLQPEQINFILNEEEGKAWEGDILDVYSAQIDVNVIAGANLAAKVASAQLAPMILQFFSAPAVQDSLQIQNKKFDADLFFTNYLDIQGFDIENLIKEMTPEDQQRAAAMNAARAKGVADQQLQTQKHENTLDEIDAKATAQAGVAIVKKAAEHHMAQAITATENMNTTGGQ